VGKTHNLVVVGSSPTRPTDGYDESCQGCRQEVSGYEYDMEPWPCATFLAIEAAVNE